MNSGAPTRIRWVLVGAVALMGAISFLDRVNISIAGRIISQEFRLSDTQLGRVFSAFFLGYGLFQVAGGRVVDYLGPRRVLAMGAAWWAVFTALTASFPISVAAPFLIFWSVRFLLGVGESVMYPSSNRWTANWIPTAERGLANGLIFAGVGAGAAITPPIIATLMRHLGWRQAFWTCALLGLVSALGWYALARDRPDQHAWVNEPERKHIREGLRKIVDRDGPRLSWEVILSSGDVWSLTLSYFCYGYTPAIFFTWFFIYLTRVRGLDSQAASYYSMVPFIAMSLGSAAGGWIADRVCKRFGRRWGRCGVASLGLAGAAALIAAGSQVPSAALASLVLALGAGSVYISQSAYWALSADLAGSSAGSVSGFMNFGCQMGAALTAMTTPWIAAHYGWTASFLTSAAFCALGAAFWLLVDPNRSLAPQDAPAPE